MKKKLLPKILIFATMFLVTGVIIAIRFRASWDNLANSDFTTFWLAGKSVVMGYDVYDSEAWLYWRHYFGATWEFNNIFIYPLPLRLLLTPLGFLSLENAYLVWGVFSEFSILASVLWFYLRQRQPEKSPALPFIVIGLVIFRPTILALRYGQFGPLELLFLTIAVILWDKKQWFWGGVVLAFMMLKPHLGVSFILFGLIWLTFHKNWKGILGLASGGIGLLVLGLVQDLRWIEKFLNVGNDLVNDFFAYGPTVWGIAGLLTGWKAVIPLGLLISMVLLGFWGWFIYKNSGALSFVDILGLLCPLVLMITPYTWAYDQVLLVIPLTLIIRKLEQRGASFLLTAMTFIIAAIFSYVLVWPVSFLSYDYLSFFLPFSIFISLLMLLNGQKSDSSKITAQQAVSTQE